MTAIARPPAPVKILFVEGAGRSGTTVLDTILGQVEGIFSTGELRYVWDRNVTKDALCGCGKPFSRCPVWTDVFAKAFGGEVDAAEVARLREAALRFRHLPKSLTGAGAASVDAQAAPYLDVLARLYTAIAEVTGARVIVDSSKDPRHGYLLRLLPGFEVTTVHVVRDPRAVVHSWQRKKLDRVAPGQMRPMGQYSLGQAAYGWMLWNLLSDAYARRHQGSYVRLRYEDFVTAPQLAIRRILDLLGEQPAKWPFVGSHSVRLATTHTVGGNPSRFSTGTVALRPDEEWRRTMPRKDRWVVTGICWPLMRRYGYLATRPVRAS